MITVNGPWCRCRAQAAFEYLTLMGSVFIIIAIGLNALDRMNIDRMARVNAVIASKRSLASGDLGIVVCVVRSDGTFSLAFENNGPLMLTLDRIEVSTTLTTPNRTLRPGDRFVLNGTGLHVSSTPGGHYQYPVTLVVTNARAGSVHGIQRTMRGFYDQGGTCIPRLCGDGICSPGESCRDDDGACRGGTCLKVSCINGCAPRPIGFNETDAGCSKQSACDGEGACRTRDGGPCEGGETCLSGTCTDGICAVLDVKKGPGEGVAR